MSKVRIGVFMGGKSHEHEVSFNSGRTVCDHIDSSRYAVVPIFQTREGSLYILPLKFIYRGKTTDFLHRLPDEAQLIVWDDLTHIIDFAFIAMHGQYAEDGRLQGALTILQIPYLGSKVFASALSINKAAQQTFLRTNDIAFPRGLALTFERIAAILDSLSAHEIMQAMLREHNLAFPLIVKPACEGSSLGVRAVHTERECVHALQQALQTCSTGQFIIIEEKLSGMEFSCVCLTNIATGEFFALPPTEVVPEANSDIFCYTQKYMPGRALKLTPARCSAEQLERIQATCIKTSKCLEMSNFSRIDGFLTNDNRVVIIDTNSISSMGPSSFLFREAAEINMTHRQLLNHVIETELHAYGMLPQPSDDKRELCMPTPNMRIAVILGGHSNERETSLDSGRNIVYKLSSTTYDALPLFLSQELKLYKLSHKQLIRNSTREIAELLDEQDHIPWHLLPSYADFVFIALHGGEGEDGTFQGMLETLGLPYNGSSVLTSALCMNKYKANQFLYAQGFHIPKQILMDKNEYALNRSDGFTHLLQRIPFPLIIKPHDDGCSFMIKKARNVNELKDALEELYMHKDIALIEECIQGIELTVGCIGNDVVQVFPPSKVVSNSGVLSVEEKFLPGAGENLTPAPLPASTLYFIQREIEKIYRSLGCKGYARIDCFYQDAAESPTGYERVVCIEINTLPGMTPATVLFHQAAELGILPSAFIERIITLGMELHVNRHPVHRSTSVMTTH